MGVTFAEHLAASNDKRLVVYYKTRDSTQLNHHTPDLTPETKIVGYFTEYQLYSKPIDSEETKLENCFRSAMGRITDRYLKRDIGEVYEESTFKFDNQCLSGHCIIPYNIKTDRILQDTKLNVKIGSKSIINDKSKNLLPYNFYVHKTDDPNSKWRKIAFYI
jgi:hypothetical protein